MQKMILGSYTKKKSQGIYTIELDTAKKELVNLTPIIKEDNPTFLDVSDNETIYAVSKEGNLGGVAAYKKESSGSYTFLNRVTEEGAPPCYVVVDEARQLVYGANYHKGLLTSYTINEDGALTLADHIQHEGDGPHENQNGPHAHYSDLTPDARLVACDLGNDTVYTYDVSSEGKLTEVSKFKAKPGTGPRHLVFHPNNQVAYLFGELSSEVIVLSYDENTGSFTEKQVISTLPEGFSDFNGGAAIRISQDGHFLYASNRGHNSLAVYKISEDGLTIELIQLISVEGDFPRDFDITPDQNFIVLANQNTDNLTLFERNEVTGELSLLQKDIFAPEVVCIKFI
ncbi:MULTISPECIES: lactonase family protein [Vagococcus]|uniref:6-phosphogluconolactonase n=1 Tax=Vagococcus fluvialis bH819 TaxID=1255619 RepID=A0A1X6WS84_9ENTE|nr:MULTISPECIES: lactonase family protein [Vagococcus]SLM87145.1 6-phosphogluconolactonase [Vagococcus fluvialis bH819]HCM90042.1 lactonase family protein [Vagococcus sp.]